MFSRTTKRSSQTTNGPTEKEDRQTYYSSTWLKLGEEQSITNYGSCGRLQGRTIRKVMGGEGNFRAAGVFFRYQIPCMNIFQSVTWIFFRINWRAWIFFSCNFPLREYFFCTSPDPPRKFSNGPSLIHRLPEGVWLRSHSTLLHKLEHNFGITGNWHG